MVIGIQYARYGWIARPKRSPNATQIVNRMAWRNAADCKFRLARNVATRLVKRIHNGCSSLALFEFRLSRGCRIARQINRRAQAVRPARPLGTSHRATPHSKNPVCPRTLSRSQLFRQRNSQYQSIRFQLDFFSGSQAVGNCRQQYRGVFAKLIQVAIAG